MKILVMACDKNEDLFPLFHHCMEKYWPDHPEIIYSTETKLNPYYKTICKNYDIKHWTTRIRETAAEIDDDNILMMLDDEFIRNKVDNNFILSLTKYMTNDVAALNLEPSFDYKDIQIDNLVCQRNINGRWLASVLCSIFNNKHIYEIFCRDESPWDFETANDVKNYKCLIMKNRYALLFGRGPNQFRSNLEPNWMFGLAGGKWSLECLAFLKQEGFNIDSTKRGIWHAK